MLDDAGRLVWTFDLASTGYVMSHCNYYAYRLAGRHVYVMASEGPSLRPDVASMMPAQTSFHLLALELTRGSVVQDVRVTDQLAAQCRIEDVDERSVLVSVGRQELRCHARLVAAAP